MLVVLIMCLGAVLGSENSPRSNLKGVAFVHRHGHRTSLGTYPTDPNVNITFPEGFAALTQKGIRELYLLGQKLRLRYDSLVSDGGLYSSRDIHVVSSYKERALMSAQSLMAGFLPPPPNSPLPIPWQPVAINVIPKETDNMILSLMPCPKYERKFMDLQENPPSSIREFLNAHPNFLEQLSIDSGLPLMDLYEAWDFYDILLLQSQFGLTVPAFGQKFLQTAGSFNEDILDLLTFTNYMKKARYGALLTDILLKFEGLVNGSETRTIFEYSGHDQTVSGLIRILGVQKQVPRMPTHGATVSFELIKETHEVEVYYWESPHAEVPKKLTLAKCERPCSVEKFRAAFSYFLIEPPTQEKYQEICALDTEANAQMSYL